MRCWWLRTGQRSMLQLSMMLRSIVVRSQSLTLCSRVYHVLARISLEKILHSCCTLTHYQCCRTVLREEVVGRIV